VKCTDHTVPHCAILFTPLKLAPSAGQSEFDSWQKQMIFLFSTVSRPALGPTKTPPMGNDSHVVFGQRFSAENRSVRRCVVVTQ
jgi:hypothetical protein